MRVAALFLHPVKSTRPVSVARAEVLPRGFRYDRRWMIVDEGGRFVSQREDPRLGRLVPRLRDDVLTLDAEDGSTPLELPAEPTGTPTRRASVWGDEVEVIDAGDAAAAWLAAQLGRGHRLVGMPPDGRRAVDEARARPGDEVSFADGVPYLLASASSLAELERRAHLRLDVRRFRPNLVVEGAAPFAEDDWDAIRIGGVPFRAVGACVRCVVTTLDPDTGTVGAEPLRTLARIRRAPDGGVTFGENLIAEGTGTLEVGDEVVVPPAA